MATKKKTLSFDSKMRALVEQEAAKHIADAPKLIQSMIEGSMLSLLGLSKDYRRQYQIDHCNGRNSVLIDAFRNCAIAEAEKIARGYKPTKDELVKFETTFKNEFWSQINRALKDAASERAKLEAEALVESIEVDVKELLAKSI